MEVNKEAKNEVLIEMAGTEGWRVIEDMLVYDVRFATSLLTRPKPSNKNEKGEYVSRTEWVKDEHEIGRARGILTTANKYLDLIKCAKERLNK